MPKLFSTPPSTFDYDGPGKFSIVFQYQVQVRCVISGFQAKNVWQHLLQDSGPGERYWLFAEIGRQQFSRVRGSVLGGFMISRFLLKKPGISFFREEWPGAH